MEIKAPTEVAEYKLDFDQVDSPEIKPSKEIALVAYLTS